VLRNFLLRTNPSILFSALRYWNIYRIPEGESKRLRERSGLKDVESIPVPPDSIPNPEYLHKDFLPANSTNFFRQVTPGFCKAYSIYAVTRAIAWLVGTVHVPLPLNPLCYLEQATSRFIGRPKPHVNNLCD
jgi:hypothetical protein